MIYEIPGPHGQVGRQDRARHGCREDRADGGMIDVATGLVWDNDEHVLDAVANSKQTILRYQGLRARSHVSPPTAARGGFPYYRKPLP